MSELREIPADVRANAERDADFFDCPELPLAVVLELMDLEKAQFVHLAHEALRRKKFLGYIPADAGKTEAAEQDLQYNARRFAELTLAKEIITKRRQAETDKRP